MKYIIATNNKKKLEELARILTPMGITPVTAAEEGFESIDPEETGATFAENAYIKAEAFCRLTGMPVIADDSGLCVDALGGEPGVFSARYAGDGGSQANIDKLLRRLEGVLAERRTARFVCHMICLFPDGRRVDAEGSCEGIIGLERVGEGGFGYDPVFMINDTESFATVPAARKDEMSHRGKALKLLAEQLKSM